MNETQLEQISEAVTHVSQPEVKVEEDFSRMSDPPEKSHLNEEEPSPVPKAPSPVIINFTASKNTNGNNEEHNNTTPTTGSFFFIILILSNILDTCKVYHYLSNNSNLT